MASITDQDRRMLDLIARGEAAKGGNPYCSLWPSSFEPNLIQMTLSEVDRFQTNRINSGFASSAVGRYQFIRKTLREAVKILGCDPLRTIYSPPVQDALIIGILKRFRGYDEWLAKTLDTDKFMIKLSQEFASMPVPYAMKGANRMVQKGESYYSGDSLNKSHHNPDTLWRELEDIRNNAPSRSDEVDLNTSGPNGVAPILGRDAKTQTASEAAGIGVGTYVGQNAGASPLPRSTLPSSGQVYNYRPLDPLDDRYDFRTGEAVKDILIHGTGAAKETPIINGNIGPALDSTTNTGSEPPTTNPGSISPDSESARDAAIAGGRTLGLFESAIVRALNVAGFSPEQAPPTRFEDPVPVKPPLLAQPLAPTGGTPSKQFPKAQ